MIAMMPGSSNRRMMVFLCIRDELAFGGGSRVGKQRANGAAVRCGDRQIFQLRQGNPPQGRAGHVAIVAAEDTQSHPMIGEWIAQLMQRSSVRSSFESRQFPEAFPVFAVLLLEKDAIAALDPGTRLVELNCLGARFLAREQSRLVRSAEGAHRTDDLI